MGREVKKRRQVHSPTAQQALKVDLHPKREHICTISTHVCRVCSTCEVVGLAVIVHTVLRRLPAQKQNYDDDDGDEDEDGDDQTDVHDDVLVLHLVSCKTEARRRNVNRRSKRQSARKLKDADRMWTRRTVTTRWCGLCCALRGVC